MKNRRQFLAKYPCPEIEVEALYVGGTITLHGRLLKIVAYADGHTREHIAGLRESIYAIIHPDGYNAMGEILASVSRAGLSLTRARMACLGDRPAVVFEAIGKGTDASWGRIEAEFPTCTRVEKEKADELFNPALYPSTAVLSNCSLCLIRPHAVKEGLAGAIIHDILKQSFEVSALQMVHLTRVEAAELLEVRLSCISLDVRRSSHHCGGWPTVGECMELRGSRRGTAVDPAGYSCRYRPCCRCLPCSELISTVALALCACMNAGIQRRRALLQCDD